MIVGIQNEILRIHSLGFLKKLLEDKTTKTNIIWATDAYGERGRSYESNQEVQIELITGVHSDIIKNRAQKSWSIRRKEQSSMQRYSHRYGSASK